MRRPATFENWTLGTRYACPLGMISNALRDPDIDSETERLLIEMCDRLLAPLIAVVILIIGRILLSA